MKKQNPNQPEHNETVVPVRSGIKENFIAPAPLDSEDRNYSFKLVVSALVVLAIDPIDKNSLFVLMPMKI